MTGTCCSRRPMMHAMPTPPVHLGNVEHQRMCWRGRRGIATTFMKQRAGLATSRLLGTPLLPHALVRLILGARVASAAGDAGLRARVLQATEVLERERPVVPLLAAVAGHARGILERDAAGAGGGGERASFVGAAASLRKRCRGRRLLNSCAPVAMTEAVDQLNAAFDTYIEHEAIADARRVGRALRRLGVERRIVAQPRAKTGWDSLTDSELKVINFIAEGATNRSVAQQLHLSPIR